MFARMRMCVVISVFVREIERVRVTESASVCVGIVCVFECKRET